MVQKIISQSILWLTLLALSVQAATPSLRLRWKGDKSPKCQQLIENFLIELRSMASDRVIELEAFDSKTSSLSEEIQLEMNCANQQKGVPESVEISSLDTEPRDKLTLRYLPKASGFDSLDWLPFQQRYLRATIETENGVTPTNSKASKPSLSDLASSQSSVSNAPFNEPTPKKNISQLSLFQRWWFWAAVGGAAAGAVALTYGVKSNSSIGVEIH